MINTHYSLYRIFPKRMAGRAERRREKAVTRRSPSDQGEDSQSHSKETPRKGNNFDGFA